MFKAVLLLSLAAVALGQFHTNNPTVDSRHGYRIQYDDTNDIIIFLNDDSCYIVEAENDRQWDSIIRDRDDLRRFEDAVFDQISDDRGITRLSHSDATQEYHSRLETAECRNRDVYRVSYRNSN